jgi:hypothetical protein
MHFSFSLLEIKGLYMFRALLAHPQEVLHERHLVYCVRIMLVVCGTVAVSPSHWTLATQKKLAYLSFHCLDHPPLSPGLAPSDYHLFSGLKTQLKDRLFVRH